MKQSLLIAILFFFISCHTNRKEKQDGYSDLSVKLDSIINKQEFNGVILVSNDSATLYSKAIGFSDLENKIKLDLNDQFVIGSISKQITAVLILKEFEKGQIDLEGKIDKYFPEINQPWTKEVTVHHLLTHTHGIVDLNKPLEFEQGSEFQYSQLGYELLAQILEKVTEKTFEGLSTKLFLECNLKNTFHPSKKKYKNLVKGYEENEIGNLVFNPNSLYNYAAAGSFISNANDLKKWNEMLHSGKLVKEETLKLMTTNYATRIHPIFNTVEYGYGLLFKDGERDIQIGALGYAPGFVSACYYYPQTKMNLVILENMAKNLNDFKQAFKVHTEIMELIKNERPTQPKLH